VLATGGSAAVCIGAVGCGAGTMSVAGNDTARAGNSCNTGGEI